MTESERHESGQDLRPFTLKTTVDRAAVADGTVTEKHPVRARKESENPTTAIPGDTRPCRSCRKTRVKHRGIKDHVYEPLDVDHEEREEVADFTTPRVMTRTGEGAKKPKPEPILLTEALVTQSLVKAVRSIDVCDHIRIKDLRLTPEYSIGDDAQLVGAQVTVTVSMMFPRGEGE